VDETDEEQANRARCLRRAAIRAALVGCVGAAGASTVVYVAGYGFQFSSFAQGLFAAAIVAGVSWVELRYGPATKSSRRRFLALIALVGAIACAGAFAGQVQSLYAQKVFTGHSPAAGFSKAITAVEAHLKDPAMMAFWCWGVAVPFMALTWLRLEEASLLKQTAFTLLATAALSCPSLYVGFRLDHVYWHDVKYVSALALGAAASIPTLYVLADRLEQRFG
jgi:hypothetical protein